MEQAKNIMIKHLKLVDDEYTLENLNDTLAEDNIEADMLNAWLNSINEALILPVVVKSVKEKKKPGFNKWLEINKIRYLGDGYSQNGQHFTLIELNHLYKNEVENQL